MDFRDNAAVGMTPYMEFHMPRSAGFFYKRRGHFLQLALRLSPCPGFDVQFSGSDVWLARGGSSIRTSSGSGIRVLYALARSVGFFFKMGPPGVGKVRGNVAKSTGTGVWSMHTGGMDAAGRCARLPASIYPVSIELLKTY